MNNWHETRTEAGFRLALPEIHVNPRFKKINDKDENITRIDPAEYLEVETLFFGS